MSHVPTDAPVPMNMHEKGRYRRASYFAEKLFPGPIGLLVSRELMAWAEFGYRLGCDKVVEQAVVELEMREEARVRQAS